MKMLKNMMIAMALFVMGAVDAKSVGSKKVSQQQPPVSAPKDQLPTREELLKKMEEAQQGQKQITGTETTTTDSKTTKDTQATDQQIAKNTADLEKKLEALQKKIDAQEQQAAMQRKQGLMQLPSATTMETTQPQTAQKPWSFEEAASGAYARAKALASYGWGKVGGGFESVKGAISRFTGSYQSTVGTGTKIALSVGAVAIAPYLGVAAATAYLSAGLATLSGGLMMGLGTYALTSAIDRLEHLYVTGEWTDAKAEEAVKGTLEEILRDTLTYPTTLSKIEALEDSYELYGLKDISNPVFATIVQNAHNSLKKQYQAFYLKETEAQEDEKSFVENVNKLREGYKSYDRLNAESLGNYASYLAAGHDLVKYEAVLSEYRRALKMKNIVEKRLQAAAQPVAQQPAKQMSASTRAPQGRPSGNPVGKK